MVTAADTREDLVPLRTDFDVIWRGYDRDQVQHYVHRMEADLRLVAVDRDAAVARAEDLARQLEAARTQNNALRQRIDRISRTPIEPDALTERLRRMAELAHEEAADITAREGVLMALHGYTANDAFAQLVEQSQRNNVKVNKLAHDLLASVRTHNDPAASWRPTVAAIRQLEEPDPGRTKVSTPQVHPHTGTR